MLRKLFDKLVALSPATVLLVGFLVSPFILAIPTIPGFPPSLQSFLPHQLLNLTAYSVAQRQSPWFKNLLIRNFIARHDIDMGEALYENPEDYTSFNDFFARPLKRGMRLQPEDPNLISSPVDGTISQLGRIDGGQIIQAKQHQYSLKALLAGSDELAERFSNGLFSTIYLSPSNYHRVHMPTAGTLQEMIYVPGSLYSVNAKATESIPGLHARNERVISIFTTDYGDMAVIMIGAMGVGSMETVWGGRINPGRETSLLVSHGLIKTDPRTTIRKTYEDDTIYLQRGDEMGLFKLGSTVIVLLASPAMNWLYQNQPGNKIQVGDALGSNESGF